MYYYIRSGRGFMLKHHHIRVMPLKHISLCAVLNHILFFHYEAELHFLHNRLFLDISFVRFQRCTLSFACFFFSYLFQIDFFLWMLEFYTKVWRENDRRWKKTETIAIGSDQKDFIITRWKQNSEVIMECVMLHNGCRKNMGAKNAINIVIE